MSPSRTWKRGEHWTREPGDGPLESDKWTSVDLQNKILSLLQLKPHAKWQLREAIGINEDRIRRELYAMKAQGLVKVVGVCLDRREWALRTERDRAPKPTAPRRKKPRSVQERYPEIFE